MCRCLSNSKRSLSFCSASSSLFSDAIRVCSACMVALYTGKGQAHSNVVAPSTMLISAQVCSKLTDVHQMQAEVDLLT